MNRPTATKNQCSRAEQERWCARCGHSKEDHQALGCMACAARCRCKYFMKTVAMRDESEKCPLCKRTGRGIDNWCLDEECPYSPIHRNIEQPEPDAPQENLTYYYRNKFLSMEAESDQYKEKLDTLVGLVETADKNTGSAVAAFNRITLRYKDWNKLRSYAEDAGGTK